MYFTQRTVTTFCRVSEKVNIVTVYTVNKKVDVVMFLPSIEPFSLYLDIFGLM